MSVRRQKLTVLVGLAVIFVTLPAFADDFSYKPPGTLTPGSGSGRPDTRIYVPNMRFPIERAPAFANSQVWGHGGMNGPGGGQCHADNYSYPWWDIFCETRSWDIPICPSGKGHQGQDIRPSTCENNVHWAVAAEDGKITNIGTYTVTLQAANGVTRHRYMHMANASLAVGVNQQVSKGDRMGRVSNNMGSTPTTIHLHYDLYQNVSGVGNTYVPPYMSLVDSYERLLGIPQEPCSAMGVEGGVIDNTDPCFELHGPPASWRYVTDAGHGGDLHWTYAWDEDRGNWAQWHIELGEAGTYLVEVHTVAAYAQATRARYVVRHHGEETEKRLDYSAGDGWRSLGEFEFAAGDDQWVTNNDNTGEPLSEQRRIIADALRLTRVEVEEPPGPEDPESPQEPDVPDVGATPDAGSTPDAGGFPDVHSPQPPDEEDATPGDTNGGSTDPADGDSTSHSTSSCATVNTMPGTMPPSALGWLAAIVGWGCWRRRRARS